MSTIALRAKVCPLDHGGPRNAATVYGHHGMTRACLRVGKSDTWIFDPRRAKTTPATPRPALPDLA